MKVWELLSDATKWCQGSATKDKYGNLAADGRKAVSWCAIGALYRCYGLDGLCRNGACGKVLAALGLTCGLDIWNDDPNRKYEEVYGLFRELDI